MQAADLPPSENYPASHQAMSGYYNGVFSFFQENYSKAEKELSFAFIYSPRRNQEYISII